MIDAYHWKTLSEAEQKETKRTIGKVRAAEAKRKAEASRISRIARDERLHRTTPKPMSIEHINGVRKLIEEQKPDFLFFVSGVDILETDKLGKLSVSIQGCYRRDEFVFQQAINHKLPIVVSMGGGYSPQIRDIVEAHCNTYRLAEKMFF